MRTYLQQSLCLGLTAAALTAGVMATAAPQIRIMPYNNARFVVGQRFDIRVEFTPSSGHNLTSAMVGIDGPPVAVALDAKNGFTLRAYSTNVAGPHAINAGAVETGDPTVAIAKTNFSVINPIGNRKRAKNIIILLGDGMGIAHRTAARIVKYGVTNGTPNGALAMDTMPGYGAVTTHSLNSIVTDSSPGMCCYTTGNHSFNGQEGVYPDNTADAFDNPRVEYMAEYLHRATGASLGIVTTADIEDATPAANAVHTANRGAGTGVCNQYFLERNRTGLAVLMGGGRRWFLPKGQFGSSRSNGNSYTLPADLAAAWGVPAGPLDQSVDLIAQFQGDGWKYATTRTDLASLPAGTTKLLGLFAYGNMNVAYDKIAKRRNPALPGVVDDYHAPDQPMLDEMTDAALNVLKKNPNGFVLMVEGAHIDKQSHLMDADRVLWETIEFDNAVGKCLDFAKKNTDTVVVVLADHECSGFSLIGALTGGINKLKALPSDAANTAPGTAPARQNAVGIYDAAGFPQYNLLADGFPETADSDNKLLIGFGGNADRFEDWLAKPLPVIDSLLSSDIKSELGAGGTATGQKYPAEPINRVPESLNGFFVRGQAPGTQAVHTATDIPVSSFSSGSNAWLQFLGVQENIDVFFKLMKAAFGGY